MPAIEPTASRVPGSRSLMARGAVRLLAAALIAAGLSTQWASAVEPTRFTWVSPESGSWDNGANWTNDQSSGSAPLADGRSGYELEFLIRDTYTATNNLNAGFLLNRMVFDDSQVTLDGNSIRFTSNGNALPTIIQEGKGRASALLSMPVSLLTDLQFGGTGSADVVFTGPLTGDGGVTMAAAGVVSLEGDNQYSGDTRVLSGTLRLGQTNAFNDRSVVEIAEGGTLELAFEGVETVGALVLEGIPQPDGIYGPGNTGRAIQGTGTLQVVTPPSSSDPSLSSLLVDSASLSPAFDPATGAYSASVPNTVTSTRLTPTVTAEGAIVSINGLPVASGTPSNPIPLAVGANLVTVVVTSPDAVTTRIYTVNVGRASAATVATNPAVVIDSSRATLNGTANPGGLATVYFEYGLSPSYGNRTPDRDVSGTLPRAFAASLDGLNGATTYHFRAVLVDAEGPIYGDDFTFTTPPNPPVVATGAPSVVTSSTATLVGAVNPNGVQASAYFELGLTTAYGQSTRVETIPAGFDLVTVQAPDVPLIPNAVYHCRIVAFTAAGTVFGDDVVFTVREGGGTGTGVPTAPPDVVTGGTTAVASESAILEGTANPNSGTTVVQFEYGPTTDYGFVTSILGVGNGSDPAAVAVPVDGLLPGATYHYRLTASNDLGQTFGGDAVFTTDLPAPTAVTGDSTVLTTTSVRVAGTARARGAPAEVWVDFSTDGLTFNSTRAVPATIDGDVVTPVSAELSDLAQGLSYFYRVRAVGPGGEGAGETLTFDVASLSGLIQQFPPGVPLEDRIGSVEVTLGPDGIGTGWRFAGEQLWRNSLIPASGLTSGDRVVEFRPVPGYVQPTSEAIAVKSSTATTPITRIYETSGAPGNGSLTVFLKPQDLTEPVASARWRFFGEGEEDWRESGTTVTGLVPGDYLILSKPVDGRTTPSPVNASVPDGGEGSVVITYYIADDPVGSPPEMIGFEAVYSDTSLPNAYVGQLRSDAGLGSGVVIRPQVVLTVGHVIFDDGTLAITGGLQWLFQRDVGVHDPIAVIPRGHNLLSGYAQQRIIDNSPGESSPESQNLDVATMHFVNFPGRGGFSGYLASDTLTNEFLASDALMTLVGYPVDGIPESDIGRMHATPPAPVSLAKAFDRTYTTPDIRASGGASGGPLCVQAPNGAFYPAAVYLGGTGQTVVRALDSDVVELIGLAEASAGDGVGVIGGTLTSLANEAYEIPDLGALRVVIEPESALAAGAGWRISSTSPYVSSGTQFDILAPGGYQVSFPSLEGFVPPAPQDVLIEAGQLTTVTFAYEEVVLPPVLTSAGAVEGINGDPFTYQLTADNAPELFSVRGALPVGLSFDAVTGLISGTLGESGVFTVTVGASNTGGTDNRELVITSFPAIESVELTVPFLEPMNFEVPSSEGGDGLNWTADGLPADLSINPNSGVISGIPQVPGVYPVDITVTRKGATSAATLTLVVTGLPPEFTLQPDAERSLQYGTTVTLQVAVTGSPDPELQWYVGPVGNTDNPVEGATSAVYTTPPLTSDTTYWVRASSISGTADSNASLIRILSSSNANLIDLLTSEGELSPAFNLGITAYSVSLPNEVTAMVLIPVVEVEQSTVTVQGILLPPGGNSEPVPLVEGATLIDIDVTSGDGSATKRYTLTVDRAPPPVIETGPAVDVDDASALLTGTVIPNGSGTAFFQHGTTTAYGNATPGIAVSGGIPLPIQTLLSGLEAGVTYHFRIGLTTGAGTIFGEDVTFTTGEAPPLVATGLPVSVIDTTARFIGAVDPAGAPTDVYFEWGETVAYGFTTPVESVPGVDNVVDIHFDAGGLVPGNTYHYRLVGNSTAGTAFGEDVSFVAGEPAGGTGIPLAPPDAVTLAPLDVTGSTAVLQASVNPQGGTTIVSFEYGPTPAYGQVLAAVGIGSGTDPATVVREVTGLLPGSTYHCRVVALNSAGTVFGNDLTFQTGSAAPVAVTGRASPVPTDRVKLEGRVRPQGVPAAVFFDYGTDGVTFPNRVQAEPSTVSGDDEVDVQVTLDGLEVATTYYYRLATVLLNDPTVAGLGEVRTFGTAELAGLLQKFPRELDASENQGRVQVNLLPAGLGGWRIVGEKEWRGSGGSVSGMATGDREIEYRPVDGYLQPAREPIGVISGAPALVIEREYFPSPNPGGGALQVILEPESRVAASPTSDRVQWRLLGGGDSGWKDSSETLEGLGPGRYLVECKKAQGLDAPPPSAVVVEAGEIRSVTFAYLPNLEAPDGTLRFPSFEDVSTDRTRPYAYIGQIRSDRGAHSGFVVRPRVVATVAQALFDEATLTQISGVQWLFQRERDVHEPKPLAPRGFYIFDGYAAQREADDTPGTLSLEAQKLNAAAIYFLTEAGRGGFSGFKATNSSNSPILDASALKILCGYPMRGGSSTSNYGRMFAVEPAPGGFTDLGDGLFATTDVLGLTGMIGAPMCVQSNGGGSYFPAAIYLGGDTSQNLVRAIDAPVIDLFARAERTANTGENNTSGGISQTSYTAFSTTATQGSLTVILEPEEARNAGAVWRLGSDSSYLLSGTRKNNLSPGDYQIELAPVDGFEQPSPQLTDVAAGSLTTVTITYQPALGALATWRLDNFGESTNSGSGSDGDDADGDGVLNLYEYLAGTDPLDPTDYFRILETGREGMTFSVVVPGRADRIYELQRTADPEAGSWLTVATAGPTASDGDLLLTDPDAPAGENYYRATVELAAP